MSGVTNYPNASSLESLRAQYVGRSLQDIDGPAAIIDVAKARKNCQLMLDAANDLGVLFRAHVKTHKTTELTRLQVGEKSDTVRLVVSTVAEAEQLKPYLEECKANGRSVDVIYGVPARPSSIRRLAALGKALGENSISVLVDNADILPCLGQYRELTGHSLGVFVKLDTGYHRAGIPPDSKQLKDLLVAIHKLEREAMPAIQLRGFYSHLGHSYGSDSITQTLDYLAQEIKLCELAVILASTMEGNSGRRFTITVGATPTTTSAQNLTSPEAVDPAEKRVKELIARVKESADIELHAGAYTVLDLQQLAAHARPAATHLSFDNLALTVLAEVASVYPHRAKPEVLIACGTLSLGREPCRSYPGWGIVTPWTEDRQAGPSGASGHYEPEGEHTGWIVDRISQEHGILSWQGPLEKMRQLKLGEKIQVWPNHCCICAAGFGYFFIVDSTREGAEKDKIVDVWLSWRGW